MILTHEDLSAIRTELGPKQAAPIIAALEKLEREQKLEVKKDLLLEIATKGDVAGLRTEMAAMRTDLKVDMAALRGEVKVDMAELRGEVKRLETLIKILIGLVVIAIFFFSPVGTELIKIIK